MPHYFEEDVLNSIERRFGIFFVADRDFLLPTIASALSVKRKVQSSDVDVRVVAISLPSETLERVKAFVEPLGILVDALDNGRLADLDLTEFNKTHVPVSTLARFFMLDSAPDVYGRILYLDGDTWPAGDPGELLRAELPGGRFAAAEDRAYFHRAETGKHGKMFRSYYDGLGIDPEKGYFNAGVILADTDTWRTVSADAFAFFKANARHCLFHDQSALNAVAGWRRVRMAPRWNFTDRYQQWHVRLQNPPAIWHFAGGEKPWMMPLHPYYETFRRAFAELEVLDLKVRNYTSTELSGVIKREKLRKLRDALLWHRRISRQRDYDRLVETSVIK